MNRARADRIRYLDDLKKYLANTYKGNNGTFLAGMSAIFSLQK